MPKVSVITGTIWKNLNYLEKTGESLANQTFQDFEWIISGHTPDNQELLNNIKNKTFIKNESLRNKTKILLNEKTVPIPISINLNRGIEYSQSELIAFLDDDDEKDNKFLEKMIALLTNNYSFAICQSITINEQSNHIGTWNVSFGLMKYPNFLKNPGAFVVNGILLIKRDTLVAIGSFDEELIASEDYDLVIRLLKNGFKFHSTTEYLNKHRKHSCQSSHAGDVGSKTVFSMGKLFKKHTADLNQHCVKCNSQLNWHKEELESYRFYISEWRFTCCKCL